MPKKKPITRKAVGRKRTVVITPRKLMGRTMRDELTGYSGKVTAVVYYHDGTSAVKLERTSNYSGQLNESWVSTDRLVLQQ